MEAWRAVGVGGGVRCLEGGACGCRRVEAGVAGCCCCCKTRRRMLRYSAMAGGRWLWKNAIARGGSENISLKNASFGKPAGIRLSSEFSTVQGSPIAAGRSREVRYLWLGPLAPDRCLGVSPKAKE